MKKLVVCLEILLIQYFFLKLKGFKHGTKKQVGIKFLFKSLISNYNQYLRSRSEWALTLEKIAELVVRNVEVILYYLLGDHKCFH